MPTIQKIIAVFFTLAVFVPITKVLAADANLYFSPSSTTVDNACYPTLDLMLDTGGQETTGVDVIIYYDSTKVNVDSLTAGSLYTNYETLEDVPSQGKIVIQARASASETFYTVAGVGEKLAAIKFKTIAFGTANITFKYNGLGETDDTNVTDTNGNDILGASVSSGTITITDGASCPGVTTDSDDDSDDDSGTGGTDVVATPTVYQAPTSGTTENTIILAGGGIFLLAIGSWLSIFRHQ